MRGGKNRRKIFLGMTLAATAGAAAWQFSRPAVEYDTALIGRGDIESSVTAVGKLQPRRFVDVGAQVSGQIQHLHVQPGDAVKKGQLLVEIDPSVQKATVDAGRASLTGLRAQLAEQQAQHMLAVRQSARQRQLDVGGATRAEDIDIADAALSTAAARIDHIKAQITQTSATVQADEVRLGYTRIYAPMDGTVVSVEAREGQTLNATYQTPNILRIADLSVMTVWTEVSEAEVRKVRAGMPVYFSTLGAERRRWHGQVRQVLPAPPSSEGKSADSALAPSSNKVIVYTALFDVDNKDGELMPQMTAQPPLPQSDPPRLLLAELREAARAAWRVMWINRFRTGLTLLGIVIGVASVIVMMAIGLGTRQQVVAQLGRFGSNLMYMASIGESSRIPGRSITLQDLEAVAEIPNIVQVLPNVTGNKVVRYGNQDIQTYVRGTGAGLPEIQTWPVARGAFFSRDDERELASVAVLGHKLARELMPGVEDPVGRHVLIGNVPFQVVGVMSQKGALTGDRDEDNILIMPFSTAGVKVFGQREPTYTVMAVADVGRILDTQEQVEALLLERHRLRDFSIGNAAASIAAEARTRDTMTMMLSLVAAVSLLVGGIGVMNVMLMTVRERTREIGIRLATGARRRDILRQFLTEAVLVTLVGGSAGVAAGLAIGLALMLAGVPLIFSLTSMLAAFGCAVATGLLFGYMPARKAARLDPVAALTAE
ncbi:MAG: Macrolide export ATP-binding/permease protein MacB [Herbaspirillum frisingense]|uniref:Macrolide export ATP-binding/permease protein MacB n=1 Tax=Herbaspirillum frisingense TaxID=92645 RepID=A0A7V8JVR8_9BURK|nr:MAG: Macrolide export ATP-binding/permease protein MacB [Herbaspirillum frisingense]